MQHAPPDFNFCWLHCSPELHLCSILAFPLPAIAKYMEKIRRGKVKFDAGRVVMAGGATGANETLMLCLASRGDVFLVPSPYYPGFNRDLWWRTGVQLLPISCESSKNFKITLEAVTETYEKAQQENIKVKGLILTNPCNPLGTILDRDTLINFLTFTDQHNIHLVCEEIYAATVFDAPQFVSIAEIIADDEICTNKDLLLCCQEFLIVNAKRSRERNEKFTSGLEEVGIKCLKSNAGVYCWMDLRPLLKEPTLDAEVSLWKLIINDAKLNISTGSSFNCPEAGWFRVCFANIDEQTVEIALARIQMFVDAYNSVNENGFLKNTSAKEE
ncbi:acetyl-coenzyme A synthetase 2 [Datura stramonium]|uniref:Acetyl-coenzyme A synthetase 2 n=1 Tax=Datura stramonium TaxID=4076 RepID=A0ABS8SY47_DATST|nr:acetyl-coenzyme A synthetase 2 [Datura stramonium]